jgi:hypothetical protein
LHLANDSVKVHTDSQQGTQASSCEQWIHFFFCFLFSPEWLRVPTYYPYLKPTLAHLFTVRHQPHDITHAHLACPVWEVDVHSQIPTHNKMDITPRPPVNICTRKTVYKLSSAKNPRHPS